MNERRGSGLAARTNGRGTRRARRGQLVAALAALLVLCCAFGALTAAGASAKPAKPGKPTAQAPIGNVATSTPTFTWSKAKSATKYELRVSQGTTQLLKQTGLTKLTWTSTTELPKNVALTWKVRGSNARGAGAWSQSLTFTYVVIEIGSAYQGGIVAYILQPNDPGYVAGETHGLIAATGDSSSMGIQWSVGGNYVATNATGTGIGTGAANTAAIIQAQGDPALAYAAGLARAYSGGGYGDWYLPSKDELRQLYLHKDAIGGSWSALYYWSSSEVSPVSAWLQNFSSGRQSTDVKQDLQGVHAVRSF